MKNEGHTNEYPSWQKEFDVIGQSRKLTEKEVASTKKRVGISYEMGLVPFSSEREKTPEDVKVFNLINSIFAQEAAELDLALPQVDIRQAHPLPLEVMRDFVKRIGYPDNLPLPLAFVWNNNIYYPADAKVDYFFVHVLIHEVAHFLSYTKYKFHSSANKPLRVYRSGYRVANSVMDTSMWGFNEAVTNKLATELYGKHLRLIEETMGWNGSKVIQTGYSIPGQILELVINKLATGLGEDRSVVWAGIKQGYFTGQMMHLRSIEKVLGKNALKVISKMPHSEDVKDLQVHRQILSYLRTGNLEEREWRALKILAKDLAEDLERISLNLTQRTPSFITEVIASLNKEDVESAQILAYKNLSDIIKHPELYNLMVSYGFIKREE